MCLAMANNEFSEICTLSVQDFRKISPSFAPTQMNAICTTWLYIVTLEILCFNLCCMHHFTSAQHRISFNFPKASKQKKKRKFNATTSQKSKSLQINASSKIRAHYAGFEFHFILYVCFRSKIESKADNACVCFLFLFVLPCVCCLAALFVVVVGFIAKTIGWNETVNHQNEHASARTNSHYHRSRITLFWCETYHNIKQTNNASWCAFELIHDTFIDIVFFFLFLWVFTQCHCSDGFSGRLISRFERKLLRKKSKWNIAYCTCTYRTNYSQWLQKLWIKIRPHWIHFQKQKSQTKKRNKQQQQYVLYLFFNCNCTKTDKQKQNQNHCENVLLCLLFVFYVWMGGGGGVGIYEFCPLVRCVFQCVPYVLMLFSFSSAAVQYLQYPKIFAIRF